MPFWREFAGVHPYMGGMAPEDVPVAETIVLNIWAPPAVLTKFL
jgi:hypothetical protein